MMTTMIKSFFALFLIVVLPMSALADSCQDAINYSAENKGLAVYVLKDGQIICEGYTNGGSEDKSNQLWSGTKSFNGIIAAAAVQDGLLTLEEHVADTITEWRGDAQKSQITIRQLLSLTSGLEKGKVGRPPTYSEAIRMSVDFPPGTKFQYSPVPFQVFGEVMKRKLVDAGQPSDVREYFKRRVADPIGMKMGEWEETSEGDPLMPHGAQLTSHDWAKYGEFVRSGAMVNGKVLVDLKTFRELFQGSQANPAYGISWWLSRSAPDLGRLSEASDVMEHADQLPYDLVFAAGAGKQRLYVIPSQGLTIVRFAKLGLGGLGGNLGGDSTPRRGRLLERLRARREGKAGRGGLKSDWSDFHFLSFFCEIKSWEYSLINSEGE